MSSNVDADPTTTAAAAAMLNQPIVIDCGSATMKAGFAGGTKPKVKVGTKVGRPKHQRVMPGGALEGEEQRISSTSRTKVSSSSSSSSAGGGGPSSYFVGRTLDEHRGAFLLDHPMERGRVVNGGWAVMELLYEHIYSKANLNAKSEEHPVLLTEVPHNPTSHRERMAEIFFESLRVPALFVAPPAVLSLYASGRTTGVVLDVGEGVTHCIPVYEGYALPHSIIRSDVAGVDVTNRLRLLLRKSGLAFSTTAESDFCATMKEEVCYVSNTPLTRSEGEYDTTSVVGADTTPKAQYQLPDGQVIDLSHERHRSSEVLFQPFLFGSEERPIHDVLLTSILQSDMDLRTTLFSNIVLSGGTTLLPGLGDRLLYEVRARAPERTKIRISAPPERRDSAWVGGSILASLTTFKNMWIGRSEYEEYGSSILYRGSL
jgi:centractin